MTVSASQTFVSSASRLEYRALLLYDNTIQFPSCSIIIIADCDVGMRLICVAAECNDHFCCTSAILVATLGGAQQTLKAGLIKP